jgi:hypothetical protein
VSRRRPFRLGRCDAAEQGTYYGWSAVYVVGEGGGQTVVGPGTIVTGTSTVSGSVSPDQDCDDKPIVGPTPPATAQTPLLHRLGIGPGVFRVVLDTFGGYDYVTCNGNDGILVGAFTPSPYSGISYTPAIGLSDSVFYANDDWFGAGAPHAQTFAGLTGTELRASGSDTTADACWNGTVQLSTDLNAEPPSLADVPAPTCFN